MTQRIEQKRLSRQKILDAAGQRIRTEGIDGAGIATVMEQAGLTHGAFYSHFANKQELVCSALEHALKDNRQRWLVGQDEVDRFACLAQRYLRSSHRDCPEQGCALAAVPSEVARAEPEVKQQYQRELVKSLDGVCAEAFETATADKQQQALAFMALMIGALGLSRAVASESLSDEILQAAESAAQKFDLQTAPGEEHE